MIGLLPVKGIFEYVRTRESTFLSARLRFTQKLVNVLHDPS